MSLQTVLEEMKKVQPFIDEDTNSGPTETLRARRGRQSHAIERMKMLKEQYSNELLSGAAFILTVGSEREAFDMLATTEGNCLGSKVESFFEDLSSRIHPSLYEGRNNTASNLFGVASRHLEDKAREIGMTEYPQLIFKSEYDKAINTGADLTALLKKAITDQVGGEVVGINAVRELTESAIDKGHSASITPIVLTTDDTKYAVELVSHLERLTPRVFLVVAGKAPKALRAMQGAIVVKDGTLESVEAALTQIRNKLKK